MFLIFNVVSGWFFLGDMGSYGLGAVLVCYGLLGVSEGDFSAGFMVCLLTHPCIDFVVSIIRRTRKGLSPLQADNGHLHNRLFAFYAQKFISRTTPNSLAGLTLSGASSSVMPHDLCPWLDPDLEQCLVRYFWAAVCCVPDHAESTKVLTDE